MELRNLAVFLGLCLLAVSQCSEARHSVYRRDAEYDDTFIGDEANEDDDSPQDDPDVPAIAVKMISEPITYEVVAGNDTRLECKVDPDGVTVVQWFQNAKQIFLGTISLSGNDRFAITDANDLIITDVKPEDAAAYKCEVATQTNELAPSVVHTLVVLEPPQIYNFTASNNGTVVEGADLLLTCKSRARPAAEIIWSRSVDGGTDNVSLGEKDGVFTTDSVHIRNIQMEHAGHYYCYVVNSIGSDQGEILVNVVGRPRVHLHKTIINSAVNVEAVLQCSVRYEDKPAISWFKDGSPIESLQIPHEISTIGTHSNLTVTPTNPDDFGTYTCQARNIFGTHRSSIELVQKPVVEALGAAGGKLSWTIHSHQPLQEITAQVHSLGGNASEWQDISIPLPSNYHHHYAIEYDLNDKVNQGKYEAIVKVKNDHSWSDAVEPIVLEIEVEPQLIQHASVYRGNSETVRPTIVLSTMMMYLLVRLL